MISARAKKETSKVDGVLLLSVLSGTILALLIWVSIVVNDIQTDLKEIHNTLDIIEISHKSIHLSERYTKICYMGQHQIDCP